MRSSSVDESNNIKNEFEKDKEVNFKEFNEADKKILTNALNMLAKENADKAFVAINTNGTKLSYIVTAGAKSKFKADEIIKHINELCNGFGGGNNGFAQGGTPNGNKKATIIDYLKTL